MHGDDLAHILRFLYGDERGLGIAQAAQDIGTKPERLREILASKRELPAEWENYLLLRTALRGRLTSWATPYGSLAFGLSERTWRAVDALRQNVKHVGAVAG